MRLPCRFLLALAATSAHADPGNVARAANVLDFDLTAPAAPVAPGEAFPGALDIDDDGEVSRAEAAGHAEITAAFDRADRNRDGKLSRAEWQRFEKWRERRAKAREAASAGATRPKGAQGTAR